MKTKMYCEKGPSNTVIKCLYDTSAVILTEYSKTKLIPTTETNILKRFSVLAASNSDIFENQEKYQKDFIDLLNAASNVNVSINTLSSGVELRLMYVGEKPTQGSDGFLLMTPKMSEWWDMQPVLGGIVKRIKEYFPDFKPELGVNGDQYLSEITKTSGLTPSKLTVRK